MAYYVATIKLEKLWSNVNAMTQTHEHTVGNAWFYHFVLPKHFDTSISVTSGKTSIPEYIIKGFLLLKVKKSIREKYSHILYSETVHFYKQELGWISMKLVTTVLDTTWSNDQD